MRTKRLAIFFFFAAAVLVCVPDAEALQISRNNPYRSFNISGYNYGSVRWEKQHQRKTPSGHPQRASSARVLRWTR